jgi:regulator of sirC expression with transglutaminase-like and TPR domain
MSSASRARFAQIVRASPVDLGLACLLLAAETDPDTEPDIDAGLRALDELAAYVADFGPVPSEPGEAADFLRRALADGAGFRGLPEDFADLRSSLLPDVLQRRRGLPILLSIVYVEVARRLDIPAHVIALPGRVVVGVGEPSEPTAGVMLDPYDDGRRLRHDDAVALVASMGMRFDPAQTAPADGADILARVLTNIRALASRQQQPRVQLWAVELSMVLPHFPAQLRRERATLRTRLGDFRAASEDLEAYSEVLEPVDPEAAEQVRREARLVRSRLN